MSRTSVAITGASSGIGEAFARKLAPGHDLLLIARRRDRLEALGEEFFNKFGTHTEVLQADLTADADLASVAQRIRSDERLALLVNNAGFGTRGRFWEADLESQQQMHSLHVMATVRLSHAALQNMVPRDFGGIINVASVSSFLRSPGTASYSATKAWMAAFTEGLHLDLAQTRSSVVVQALCPGFTYSEFHDRAGADRYKIAGPSWWLTPEEVVAASLEGLTQRKIFVVPGWRYKLLTSIVPRLPGKVRLAFEGSVTRLRDRRPLLETTSPKQIDNG